MLPMHPKIMGTGKTLPTQMGKPGELSPNSTIPNIPHHL